MIFSSVVALVGPPGQANYATANTLLDLAAHFHNALGMNVKSLQWGAWSGGMAARGGGVDILKRFERLGLGVLRPAEGLGVLKDVALARICSNVLAASPFDWRVMAHHVKPSATDLFVEMLPKISGVPQQRSMDGAARTPSIAAAGISTVVSLDEVQRRVLGVVAGMIDDGDIQLHDPLMESGIDSLGAIELRNTLASEFSVTLPATFMFDAPSIAAMARFVRDLLVEQAGGDRLVIAEQQRMTNDATAVSADTLLLGASCVYGHGIRQLESFSTFSASARDATEVTPLERWDNDVVYGPTAAHPPARTYVALASYIEGAFDFAPNLYRLTASEAATLDPQARHALNGTLDATHSAVSGGAYAAVSDVLPSYAGVFVGLMWSEMPALAGSAYTSNAYAFLGGTYWSLVGRISFVFGLSGMCASIDTACSSSLVAAHAARRAVQNDEVAGSGAFVTGVNLMLYVGTSASICALSALSADGRCKTYDASGDGYGRGEGATTLHLNAAAGGTVVDSRGVIARMAGSHVNEDGRSSSLTAPHGPSQKLLIDAALADARRCDAGADRVVCFVAVHGTGTALGDPIEVSALGKAYARMGAMAFGSNKSIFGHTEGAAGVTGMAFALASLARGGASFAMPSLCTLNAFVAGSIDADWMHPSLGDGTSVTIPREGGPHVYAVPTHEIGASTSSFGMSGVNAHAVLAPITATEVGEVMMRSTSLSLLQLLGRQMWLRPAANALANGPFARPSINAAEFEMCAAIFLVSVIIYKNIPLF